MNPEGELERVDATRRTRLASERTYLAWWRSGLTAFAVSIGFGKVVPGVTNVVHWPYAIAGAGYALIGTFFIVYGAYRQRVVDRALDRGEFVPPGTRVMLFLSVAGICLGLLTLVLVFVSG